MSDNFLTPEEIKNAFAGIKAPDASVEKLKRRVCVEKSRKPMHTFKHMAATAAVICACLVMMTETGLADTVKSYIQSLFDNGTVISEEIHRCVYEDRDEHVSMQIDEFLTDGSYHYMVVTYQALDEEGENWLNQLDEKDPQELFNMDVQEKDITGIYSPKISWDVEGIPSENFPASRSFKLLYEEYRMINLSGTDRKIFCYSMPEGIREHELQLPEKMPVYTYKLVSDQRISEYYNPQYLLISGLSFTLLGENCGMVEVQISEDSHYEASLIPDDVYDAELKKVENMTFFTDDGSFQGHLSVALGSTEALQPELAEAGLDFCVAQGSFWAEHEGAEIVVDPETLTELSIGDVIYRLELAELS